MVRSLAPRATSKPVALALSFLLALFFVPAVAGSAQAVGADDLFEIEGNLIDDTETDPPIDWEDLAPGDANFVTGVDNTTATGQDSTVFSGASKEYNAPDEAGGWPGWTFGTGNATGKSDFGRWATYDLVDGDDHVWLFFAFDRKAGEGTAKYVFELNQVRQSSSTDPNPVRSQGDVRLVVWDQGNGVVTLVGDDKNTDVGLWIWDDPDQPAGGVAVDSDRDGTWVVSTAAGVFDGASNTGETPVAVPAWWTSGNVDDGTLAKDEFLEFGIDLTSFGAVLGCPSSGFSAINARSITGTGGPGTLVDYLSMIPVTIPSECTNLVIHKQDGDGDPLGGATFSIAPNPFDTEGTAPVVIFDDSTDDGGTLEPGTTHDDPDATPGRITLTNVVPDVEYTVTETIAPDGYLRDGQAETVTPAFPGGGSVTFVNTLGSVRFFKSYAGGANSTGARFLLERDGSDEDSLFDDGAKTVQDNVTGDATTVDDLDPTMGEIEVSGLMTGAWRITEVSAPTGWEPDPDTGTFTISEQTPNVTLGSPTFENPRRTYPLSVLKVGVAPGDAADGSPIAGTVFRLWRDTNGAAGLQATDTAAGDCTTAADGTCSVTGQPWGFDYYWEEISVPAPWNLPTVTVQGPVRLNADGSTTPGTAVTFADPKSKIVTKATNSSLPGAAITDTATLSGLNDRAAGTVTFDVYGPFATDPTGASCTAAAKLNTTPIAATRTVTGNGDYTSVPVTVTRAGFYAWIAHYSGDGNGNRAVSGACDDAGETSYVVGPGALSIVKTVSPVAGDGVVVEFGDRLTYTLTVTASGEPNQPNVVVTDYVPGSDPARPASGSTTYVPGSAACVGTGTCSVTEPGADGLITWRLGEMATGTSRQVTFQVDIDPVEIEGGSVTVDIINAGAVRSDRVPRTESNEVVTPVTAVLPVKVVRPRVLPRTGVTLPLGLVGGSAVSLLGLGLLLQFAGRRDGSLDRTGDGR